jgi:hypothetical protein
VSEVHLFLIWSNARQHEAEILADLALRFRLLEVVEVTWSREGFLHDLRCFYGTDLPPGSDKEAESGTGPFLACVVEDERPRYRYRRAGRRLVRENRRLMDARASYRAIAGGGYRVHASADRREAERDLVLLFGRRPTEFLGRTWDPGLDRSQHVGDVLGSHGWRDLNELLLALEVTSGVRKIDAPVGVDLALQVRDKWWAEQILHGADVGPNLWQIELAGQPRTVQLVERRSWIRT